MVESRSRKAAFLSAAARELDLTPAEVVCGRVEALAPTRAHQFSLITVRAVRLDVDFWGAIASLAAPGGQVLVFGVESPGLAPEVGFEQKASAPLPGGSHLSVFECST
jgi:16S rRNA G527 N7-methylase RsmG